MCHTIYSNIIIFINSTITKVNQIWAASLLFDPNKSKHSSSLSKSHGVWTCKQNQEMESVCHFYYQIIFSSINMNYMQEDILVRFFYMDILSWVTSISWSTNQKVLLEYKWLWTIFVTRPKSNLLVRFSDSKAQIDYRWLQQQQFVNEPLLAKHVAFVWANFTNPTSEASLYQSSSSQE